MEGNNHNNNNNNKEEESTRLLPSLLSGGEESEEEDAAFEAREKIDVEEGPGSADSAVDYVPPFSWKKLWMFTGPGFLMSIGFLDPGNLEGDLQAGAIAGYSLLWLLLWATVMGLLIQLLSARLGVATGRHLAELCRDEYPNWARLVLWFMAEVALIGADIQEVIGSAIAIQILSRGVLPLWAGVLITASDWCNYYNIESSIALLVSFMINLFVTTVFAKGFYGTAQAKGIGLVNAGQYLEEKYGGGVFPILYIWGVGLLAAGQSSTITGTYAGQFIMGGFLNLRLKKWLRALITRSFAIGPTIIVAIVFNKSEASLDVLNSMQIPFALIPLLTLVAKEQVMGVFKVGPVIERLAWTIAVVVMLINGYLLIDFFASEVKGFLFGFLACTGTGAYIAFIIYLALHGGVFSSSTSLGIELSKQNSISGN
ncbi:Metal transporter Nramp2 [Linum perenne]